MMEDRLSWQWVGPFPVVIGFPAGRARPENPTISQAWATWIDAVTEAKSCGSTSRYKFRVFRVKPGYWRLEMTRRHYGETKASRRAVVRWTDESSPRIRRQAEVYKSEENNARQLDR